MSLRQDANYSINLANWKNNKEKKGPFIYQEFNSTCTMQIISVHIQNTVHILYPSQDTYLSFCANKNRVNIQLIGGLGWWLLLKAGWWPGDSLPRSVAHFKTHNQCPLHRCNSCQKKKVRNWFIYSKGLIYKINANISKGTDCLSSSG